MRDSYTDSMQNCSVKSRSRAFETVFLKVCFSNPNCQEERRETDLLNTNGIFHVIFWFFNKYVHYKKWWVMIKDVLLCERQAHCKISVDICHQHFLTKQFRRAWARLFKHWWFAAPNVQFSEIPGRWGLVLLHGSRQTYEGWRGLFSGPLQGRTGQSMLLLMPRLKMLHVGNFLEVLCICYSQQLFGDQCCLSSGHLLI